MICTSAGTYSMSFALWAYAYSLQAELCSKETSLEKALEYLGYSPLDAPTFNMALKQAMTRLTDKEQIVLRYCYEARLTQEQTAIKLGCSERSIRRYHAKALHKLKQILD